MTSKEKKALYTCNTLDLIRKINDPIYKGNKEQQFNDIVEYIARNGMQGGNTKSEIFDLIYAARNELIAQEAKEHKEAKKDSSYNQINGVSKDYSDRIKNFILNPVESLKKEFLKVGTALAQENTDDEDKLEYNQRVVTNMNFYLQTKFMDISKESMTYRYGDNPVRTDVMDRFMRRLPNDYKSVDEAIKSVNGNFFTRLFRRPSKEYKAFEESLNTFREAGKVHSGNTEDLEKKTNAYLKHIIPEYDVKKLGQNKIAWLDTLPSSKRARAELAIKAIESINEHKEMKAFMENVDKGLNGKPVEAQKVEQVPVVDNQKEFQKDLAKDIQEEVKEEKKVEEKESAKEEKVIEEESLEK